MALTLSINGTTHTVDVEPATPLLWVIRDNIGLSGTKYGCGIAKCGFCTVHMDGQPVKACQTKASAAVGKAITTIEGLSADASHPVPRPVRTPSVRRSPPPDHGGGGAYRNTSASQ